MTQRKRLDVIKPPVDSGVALISSGALQPTRNSDAEEASHMKEVQLVYLGMLFVPVRA